MAEAAEKLPEEQDAPDTGTDAAETPETPFVKANPITQSRFQLAAEVRNPWMVTCEKGTTVEQILDGGYWANVARMIKPGDEIIVRPDDMAWELVLHVTGSEHLFVHVVKKVLYELRSSTPPVSVPSRYKVEHAGSHHKWRVLRDGDPLKDGFETEDLARRYAKNHQAAVNR